MPASKDWSKIAYGNDKFVAISRNSIDAAYSKDGITWMPTFLPSNNEWNGITYGDGKFIAVASESSDVIYSEDGINWKTDKKIITKNEEDITSSVLDMFSNITHKELILESSTEGSAKKFKITVDDNGTLNAVEI
jgi:hypothetical protein